MYLIIASIWLISKELSFSASKTNQRISTNRRKLRNRKDKSKWLSGSWARTSRTSHWWWREQRSTTRSSPQRCGDCWRSGRTFQCLHERPWTRTVTWYCQCRVHPEKNTIFMVEESFQMWTPVWNRVLEDTTMRIREVMHDLVSVDLHTFWIHFTL